MALPGEVRGCLLLLEEDLGREREMEVIDYAH